MSQKFKCVYSTEDGRFLVGNADWVEPYGSPWDFFHNSANAGLVEFAHNYPDRVLSGEITDGVFTANAIEELEKEIYYGAAEAVKMLTPFGIAYEPPKTDVYFGGEPVLDVWSAEAKKNLAQEDSYYGKQIHGKAYIDNKAIKDMDL